MTPVGQTWVDTAVPASFPPCVMVRRPVLRAQPLLRRHQRPQPRQRPRTRSLALRVGACFLPEQRLLLHQPASWNNLQVPGFGIALGELVEGLLGPKQRPWSLLLHFALEPTPSGSEEEGEEA